MKTLKALLIVLVSTALYNCGQMNNRKVAAVDTDSVVEVEYNDEVTINECVSDKKIPNGLTLGEVVEYIGKNKEEEIVLIACPGNQESQSFVAVLSELIDVKKV